MQPSPDRNNPQPLRVVGIQHRHDLRLLNEEGVRFEIDMCIGCDRCMRACPVPLSSSINIAELNHATITDEVSPLVKRFTDECVMCGSCVPVCPVNNHRDLLMLSLKQRLGIAWDGQVDMNRIFQYLPPGWDVPSLINRLRDQPMFSDAQLVPDNYLLHIVAASKLLMLTHDAVILHEGEFGRSLYLILYGKVGLYRKGEAGPLPKASPVPAGAGSFPGANSLPGISSLPSEGLQVAVARRGEFIGEHGLMTGQPRTATARTLTASVILEIPEQVMQSLMDIVPAVRAFFNALNNTRSVGTIMKRMALFQGVSEVDIRAVAEKAVIKRFDRGEHVFGEDLLKGVDRSSQRPRQEGSAQRPASEVLHLVLEGFVKVARATQVGTGRGKTGERIIAYRQTGDYFLGGLDLLGDGQPVTVTAITRVSVAEVPRQTMLALFARYPEVGYRFRSQLQQYVDVAALAQTSVFDPLNYAQERAGLRALVGDGVVEGTEVLIIDLDKCIHCNECEEACARRHGHSRMNRKGMVVGNISIATACRHCQDPVCMLCSRAGIARHPSGEVYITDSCIGCGICAERCPYDNISIVTLEEEDSPAPSSWRRFSSFFTKGGGKEQGRKVLPMIAPEKRADLASASPMNPVEEMRKKVAIKCDLCAGYNNQACVQACPTGAALRVQPAQFFGSTENILRRRTV
jgi:Fe-S-cluster-containing hydrogenase component 2/CRP-like cAMP-binding protein